jgi:type IV secretion system protein VirD4
MKPYKKRFKPYFYLSIILFYAGYVLGNFLSFIPGYDLGSRIWFLMNGDVELYVSEQFQTFLYYPSFLAFVVGLMGFLIGLMIFVQGNDSGTYRNGEEHGSARYATKDEIEKYADEDPDMDMIYTRSARMGLYNSRLKYEYQRNKNTMILGGPGSGKTFTFIKPNIMQGNASFVTVDPKGLVVREVGKLLTDLGYKIKIFDLFSLANSDHFNIFNYIETELDIDRVLEFITEGTKKSDQNSEDFWVAAEALLIRSFIAYLWFDGKDNDYTPNLSMIADMLRLTERKDKKVPSPVEEWFEELNERHPNNYAYKQWTLFNDLYAAETRMSVLGIAAARYSVFDHEQVVDMIRDDTMDIDTWNVEKTAVFIAIPETSTAYNFLASMFLGTVMERLRTNVDKIKQGLMKLKSNQKLLHFRFLIDEFYNIGRIPNIDKAMGVFRSREMSVVVVLQALDQLKTMYKDGWKTILNLCDSVLYLGGDEEDTLAYLSKRAGKQTINLKKQSVNKGKNGGGSESRDKTGRDLLTPDEISRIRKGDHALLFISGEHAFLDKKYHLSMHKYSNEVAKDYNSPNWYQYKRYRDETEKILDQIQPEDIIDHGTIGEAA